jgi:hypothetical protein
MPIDNLPDLEIVFNDDTIRTAVKLWFVDEELCTEIFGHISEWNVSGVTTMNGLFKDRCNFNEPLNNWDVLGVDDMGAMFYNASSFNQPLNNWDVRFVENMNGMFQYARSFNQSLACWNIPLYTETEYMLAGTPIEHELEYYPKRSRL